MKRYLSLVMAVVFVALTLCGCSVDINVGKLDALESAINDFNQYFVSNDLLVSEEESVKVQIIDEDGIYDSKDDVALYIHTYNKLPKNYITKDAARLLGWEGGSLEEYVPNMSIGGDRFGNYEELLPTHVGRTYYECDIGTLGKDSRGVERIVYSNDGLVYYTNDHYATFELLYGISG